MATVLSLKVTNINSLLPFLNCFVTSLGNISLGIVVPIISLADTTLTTPSISLYFSSKSKTSFDDIFSTTHIAKDPISKSSANISCPFIVSISSGR